MDVQLTITLALIGVSAIVALICDFLRARNALLRRAMTDLENREQALQKTAGERRAGTNKPAAAAPRVRDGQRGPLRPLPPRQAKNQAMTSNTALSAWLTQRAASRAAQRTLQESRAESVPAAPRMPQILPERGPAPDRILRPFALPPRPVPVCIDAYLWDSLIASKPAAATAPATTFELIQGAGTAKFDLEVPPGMHDAGTLQQLTASRKLFSGLVISISVNQQETAAVNAGEPAQSIESLVAGLLREPDFGCQLANNEFVLICPGPGGAEAQRRLSDVSERLWDFQLRMLGKVSVLFNVGGVDVQRESLSDAIASAKERMGRTRRSGTVSRNLAVQHRQAG